MTGSIENGTEISISIKKTCNFLTIWGTVLCQELCSMEVVIPVFPKILLLAQTFRLYKNKHRYSHPCSRKYIVLEWRASKIKYYVSGLILYSCKYISLAYSRNNPLFHLALIHLHLLCVVLPNIPFSQASWKYILIFCHMTLCRQEYINRYRGRCPFLEWQ